MHNTWLHGKTTATMTIWKYQRRVSMRYWRADDQLNILSNGADQIYVALVRYIREATTCSLQSIDLRSNMNWMVSATWWLPREKLQAWQAFVIWICDGISEQLGHPSVLVVLVVVVVVVWYLIAVAALPPLLSCTSIVRPSAHRARALEHVHGQEA